MLYSLTLIITHGCADRAAEPGLGWTVSYTAPHLTHELAVRLGQVSRLLWQHTS